MPRYIAAVPVLAQDSALMDRIGRLERDVTFLQRQIYRGASVDPNAPAAGSKWLQRCTGDYSS